MTTFTYDIRQFKFYTANAEQVIKDFNRDYKLIFINGMSLEEIYKDMHIIVSLENHIREDCLLKLWNKYCFIGAHKALLPYWIKFANALFHQGGLLYAFEASLIEKMSDKDNIKAYIPGNHKKEVHISFDNQGLTIQEKCVFTELKDSSGDEENNLIAKNGGYLIKAKLFHRIELINEHDQLAFQHVILQPEFKCENSELRKCLNQSRLSIWDFIKNFIIKIFRLKFEPNKCLFFQKPYYENKIDLDSNSCLITGDSYTKITNRS